MSAKNMQTQIDEINSKLDFILEEIHHQKQNRESMEDLFADLSLVGKDAFQQTVIELDNAGVELDSEAVKGMGLRLIRNIGNLNQLLETLESLNDFMKDAVPVMHQVGLDAIHQMNDLNEKGYVDFFKELIKVVQNIIEHFSPTDVKDLADSAVSILETIKSLTQPDMLSAINNAVTIFKNLDPKDVEQYNIWKLMREFNKPEMKRGIGFAVTFLKKMAQETETDN